MPTIEEIGAAFEAASNKWQGADWTHEVKRSGRIVLYHGCSSHGQACVNEDGRPCSVRYCDGDHDGGDGCEVCDEVESDAITAQETAEVAMGKVHDCKLSEAATLADTACRLERLWGDDPNWGEFYRLVRLAADEGYIAVRCDCGDVTGVRCE